MSSPRLSDDAVWELARAYCPRPGEDPCEICFTEIQDELAGFGPDVLSPEMLGELREALIPRDGLDTCEIASWVSRRVAEKRRRDV